MQVRKSVVNFHKHTSNEKTLMDWYHSTFDKGIRSIKVTRRSKLPLFTVINLLTLLENLEYFQCSSTTRDLTSMKKTLSLTSQFSVDSENFKGIKNQRSY